MLYRALNQISSIFASRGPRVFSCLPVFDGAGVRITRGGADGLRPFYRDLVDNIGWIPVVSLAITGNGTAGKEAYPQRIDDGFDEVF
jgi:hypothetical protein